MNEIIKDSDYKNWFIELKDKIRNSQIKAAIAVNSELISLYWEIGQNISKLQLKSAYGDGLIKQLSKDLRNEFPDVGGFSYSNLKYCRQFYMFWSDFVNSQQLVGDSKAVSENIEKSQQLVRQIPWGHNILILQKVKHGAEALFYVKETIDNNWSRAILGIQIESNLYDRQGKALSNFANTLPKPQSDLAIQTLKDPYIFSFLSLEANVQELELERKLVDNIARFLLELGKGFAYMGRQYKLKVGEKEYILDLLFYHVKLKCYVVIELKTGMFEPEFIGKLNFYLSAIDAQLRDEKDTPTIGMLLCRTKDKLNVEFSLKDVNKPIGVSEYLFNELPEEIKREMPTVEELELELFKDDGK